MAHGPPVADPLGFPVLTFPMNARLAIIRLRSLGDCVLSTPAIHLAKQARPDLRIGVVVEDRFAAVYAGNPDVETILAPDLGAIARWGADVCLNLHGGTRSMWLTAASLARVRAGFGHYRNPWLYNVKLPRAQAVLGEERTVHTAEHVASAFFHMGIPKAEIPRARLFCDPAPAGPAYAAIHPFASAPEKTWPAERFLAVARALPFEAVFIGGPGDDMTSFAGYRTLAGAPLKQAMSLLSGASLFVGNDSGPAHMAAAFGVPSVVLFGSSDPVVWAPWRTAAEVIEGRGAMRAIETDRVRAAIRRLGVKA